jgi:hypothetical protein
MNKDSLTQRWEAMRVCTHPEATYNELLSLNQECKEAGAGYTEIQVASKFVHLLQTADDHAYIHLLTELARTGENSMIRDLWFIAQITCNQLKVISARPPPASHHLGMSASYQQGQGSPPQDQGPPFPCENSTAKCDWCGGPHMGDECFRKDPCNVLRFPLPEWPGGIPPASILAKYRKPHPRNPDWYLSRKTPTHQASVASISRMNHFAPSAAASATVSDRAAGLEGISCNDVKNIW